MALVVNSNISSLNAQRQLNSSAGELNKASERLASGQRINSAADDAAGLAITNRQTSQIRGLEQAIRNSNDGISLIQTAEGALDESTNILQRMRELAVQASNGIYSDTDRATLDAEVQQLVAELDRIAETTSFNGKKLLDGSQGDIKLQVGSERDQTISFSINAMDTKTLGLGSTSSDLSGAAVGGVAIGDGDVMINGQGLSSYTSTADNENLQTLIDDINKNVDGVTASAFNVVEASNLGSGVMASGDSLQIELHSVKGGASTTFNINAVTTSNMEELAAEINSATGGVVSASVSEAGKLVLSNTTGATMSITADAATQAATGLAASTVSNGSLSLKSDDGGAITVTRGVNGTDDQLKSLGFREISGAGEVLGEELSAAGEQDVGLAAGDLKINGVVVSAANTDNLTNKVANINAVSDKTGVTASITAKDSFAFDGAATSVEVSSGASPGTIVTGGTLEINGHALTTTLVVGDDMTTVAAAINTDKAATGVSAYVDDDGAIHLFSESTINLGGTSSFAADTGIAAASSASAVSSGSIKLNGAEISLTDLTDINAVVSNINAEQGTTGVQASVDKNGQLQLSSSAAIKMEVGNDNGLQAAQALGVNFVDAGNDGTLSNDVVTILPRIKLDSANDAPVKVEVSANGATATGLSNMNTDLSSTVTGSALSSISVATEAGAQDALDAIDNALETINDTRSQLGAVNNRLDFTVSNLGNIVEKSAAARSRILDADFAAETAALSKAQVLQQASQAMLAQANARPQQVLSLLQ